MIIKEKVTFFVSILENMAETKVIFIDYDSEDEIAWSLPDFKSKEDSPSSIHGDAVMNSSDENDSDQNNSDDGLIERQHQGMEKVL